MSYGEKRKPSLDINKLPSDSAKLLPGRGKLEDETSATPAKEQLSTKKESEAAKEDVSKEKEDSSNDDNSIPENFTAVVKPEIQNSGNKKSPNISPVDDPADLRDYRAIQVLKNSSTGKTRTMLKMQMF